MIKVNTLKSNKSNPRKISEAKLEKLAASIDGFKKMMELRPIIVDETMTILAGNKRFAAIKSLKLKEIPDEWVKVASDLTDNEKRELVIKDNVGFGEWDWDIIGSEWSDLPLGEWGLDVPILAPDVDYSILDGDDLDDHLNEMASGVKKSIQIEFENEHYEEAYALIKFWREKQLYIGGFIMEKLKEEKEKI